LIEILSKIIVNIVIKMNEQLPIIALSQNGSNPTQLHINKEQFEDSLQKRLKAQRDEIARNQQVIDAQMKTIEQQNIMLSLNHTKLAQQEQLIVNQNVSIQHNSTVFAQLNQQCQTSYHQMMELNNKIIEHQKYLEQQANNQIYYNQYCNNWNEFDYGCDVNEENNTQQTKKKQRRRR
jgi:hypothetical protein